MGQPAGRLVLGLALFGLCAAYLHGELLEWPGAAAEAAHFGLPATFAAAGAIATELVRSALVLLAACAVSARSGSRPSPWPRLVAIRF